MDWNTVRLWLSWIGRFAWSAVRRDVRVPVVGEALSVVGFGGVGIVIFLIVRGSWDTSWAVVAVLVYVGLLLAVEGGELVRDEMLRAEVDLEFTLPRGTWYGTTDGGFMQYAVDVTNLGPDSRFSAAVSSEVVGATEALPYGHFDVGWEGTGDHHAPILRGRTQHAVIGVYYPSIRGFEFRVPPSPHSGDQSYQYGPTQVMQHNRWKLEFWFNVRDVQRDSPGETRKLRVAFENEAADCPVLCDVTDEAVERGQPATSRGAMRVINGAQPIRRYGPPGWVVWTSGDPCTEQDCAALTVALHRGEVEIIEHGRWGQYNVILKWTYPERKPWYFLAELRDAAPDVPS